MNFVGFVRTHEPERNCVHLNDPVRVSQRLKLHTQKINTINNRISSFCSDI